MMNEGIRNASEEKCVGRYIKDYCCVVQMTPAISNISRKGYNGKILNVSVRQSGRQP